MINMENIEIETPKTIYLQIGDEVDLSFVSFKDLHKDAITWCEDRINVNDIEYINKEYSDQQNKALLDEIDMLKFQLKAADSVNEQLQFQYNELEKAMYKLTISNDNN